MSKLAFLGLALLVLGCGPDNGGGGADMATPPPIVHNFDQIVSEVFAPSCNSFSVCHSPQGKSQANKLDLKTDPYQELVGVLSVNSKAMGQGILRVKPCDSAHSFLIIKMTLPMNLDPMTDYGAYMPNTSPHLDDVTIQGIKDWIDRGALMTESPTVTGNHCLLSNDMAVHD